MQNSERKIFGRIKWKMEERFEIQCVFLLLFSHWFNSLNLVVSFLFCTFSSNLMTAPFDSLYTIWYWASKVEYRRQMKKKKKRKHIHLKRAMKIEDRDIMRVEQRKWHEMSVKIGEMYRQTNSTYIECWEKKIVEKLKILKKVKMASVRWHNVFLPEPSSHTVVTQNILHI